MSTIPPPPPPGDGPPPGGDAPWWAQAGSGETPTWWKEPGPAPNPYQAPPGHMPFTPAPDPVYSGTYAPRPTGTAKGAVAALVWGILSLTCCGAIGGAFAIYHGSQARYRIRVSNGRLGGNGLALAGLVMGIMSLCGTVLYILLLLTGQVHFVTYQPATNP